MTTHMFFRERLLHLEGGSQDVVKLMKENNNVHSDVLILVDIWKMVIEFPAFEVSHTLQEGNVGANWWCHLVERGIGQEI